MGPACLLLCEHFVVVVSYPASYTCIRALIMSFKYIAALIVPHRHLRLIPSKDNTFPSRLLAAFPRLLHPRSLSGFLSPQGGDGFIIFC